MTRWHTRTTCINCGAALTAGNTRYSLSHGKYYPRPECSRCHSESCRLAMRRSRERRRELVLVRPSGRWWEEKLNEIRLAQKGFNQ
jgi:hypothetical protein